MARLVPLVAAAGLLAAGRTAASLNGVLWGNIPTMANAPSALESPPPGCTCVSSDKYVVCLRCQLPWRWFV